MAFLFMLIGFFGVLHIPPMGRFWKTPREKAAVAMGFSFLVTGSLHFTDPGRFLPLMPPWVPWHREAIYFSGFFEVLGAVGLMSRASRRMAGYGLAALLICVFPANIHVAVSGGQIEGLPAEPWYYWARLPLQGVFILWAIYCARTPPAAEQRL